MKAQRKNYSREPRYANRLIVTVIAILAVSAAIIIPAKLLGEFVWLTAG